MCLSWNYYFLYPVLDLETYTSEIGLLSCGYLSDLRGLNNTPDSSLVAPWMLKGYGSLKSHINTEIDCECTSTHQL